MSDFNQKKYDLLVSFLENFFDFKKNKSIISTISNNNIRYKNCYDVIIEDYNKEKKINDFYFNSYILISHLYEEYVINNNKDQGVFYTPFEIVSYIINDIKEKFEKQKWVELTKIKILDPSAWTGLFIIWILKHLTDNNFNIKDIYDLFKKNIFVFDIDNNSLKLLEKFLKIFFEKEYNITTFSLSNIYNKDFIDYKFDNKEKFDIIIWNPPYGLSSKKYKKEFIKTLKIDNQDVKNVEEKDLPNDIYWLFYIKSLYLLKKNGIIEFITPNSILNNKTFYWTRKILFNKIKKIDIIDSTFKKKEIGKKAGIDTIIVKIKNRQNINRLLIRKLQLQLDNNVPQKNMIDNFVVLQKNIIDKDRLKEIFLLPFSIDLTNEILNILYDTYKNRKYKLIKNYFDSAMWIKTSNNKKYVSINKDNKFNIPFVKGTSKEEQKNKVSLYDYINFEQLKKDKPKNSNIPQEQFLDLNIYKLWFPEIWHKGIIRAFVYKDMLVSNSVWIYIPKEKYKNKLWLKKIEKISKIINSEIYEKISKVYSNWIRIEKHIIDNLPLLLNF